MMTVVFKEPEKYLYSPRVFFDNNYLVEWMCDPLVRQIIKDIDRVDLINPTSGFSPILGSISIRELSGGTKGLILALKDPDYRAFSSTMWGDNCADWLCRISFLTDFTFYVRHYFSFIEGDSEEAPAILDRPVNAVGEDGTVLRTSKELSAYICMRNIHEEE